MLAQVLRQLLAAFEAHSQHDEDMDRVSLHLVRQPDRRRFGHRRV